MEPEPTFADIPLDVLKQIVENHSIVLSGKLALTNRFWRTFTWKHLLNTLRIWPAVDQVLKLKDADMLVTTIKSRYLSTSVRHLRVYVSNSRSLDSAYFSMSPKACSQILVSCKETLRHLAIGFANQPNLTGLTPEAFDMASSLQTMELVVTNSTRTWCYQFLSRCCGLEKLVLTLLQDDCPEISAEFLSKSCPQLRELSISCRNDSWKRFRDNETLTKMIVRCTVELGNIGYGWDGNPFCVIVRASKLAPVLVSYLTSEDPLPAIKQMVSMLPINVQTNFSVEVTVAGTQVDGKITALNFTPIMRILNENSIGGNTIAGLQYLADTGTDIRSDICFLPNEPVRVNVVTVGIYFAIKAVYEKERNGQEHSQLIAHRTVPIIDFLVQSAKCDLTKPLNLQSFIQQMEHIDWALGKHYPLLLRHTFRQLGVAVHDSSNLFYISCQYDGLSDLAQHLLTSSYLQQLTQEGKGKAALMGPGKSTLLMAAASTGSKVLTYLLSNLDILIDEEIYEKRRAAVRDLLNARDVEGRTALHIAAVHRRVQNGRGQPSEQIKELVRAGADVFLYSEELGVPPPFLDIPLSILQCVPKTYALNIEGFAYAFFVALADSFDNTESPGLGALVQLARKKRHIHKVVQWRHPLTGMSFLHIAIRYPKVALFFAKALLKSIDLNAPSPFGTPLFYSDLMSGGRGAKAIKELEQLGASARPDGLSEETLQIGLVPPFVSQKLLESVKEKLEPVTHEDSSAKDPTRGLLIKHLSQTAER